MCSTPTRSRAISSCATRRRGETLVALDGKTYTLDETMGVIADDNGAELLAGIMGGEASGCDETTTDVLIESALWDPLNIAQTGRKLGINSDARYRFERGVDPAFMVAGPASSRRRWCSTCAAACRPRSRSQAMRMAKTASSISRSPR